MMKELRNLRRNCLMKADQTLGPNIQARFLILKTLAYL